MQTLTTMNTNTTNTMVTNTNTIETLSRPVKLMILWLTHFMLPLEN